VVGKKLERIRPAASAIHGSVERIRNLLEERKFYDPDANVDRDEYFNEDDWTERDLMAPGLKNVQDHIRKQENSALAAVKELREEERNERLNQIAQYDVDGSLMALYRIWSLIPPVYRMSREELAQMLANRVLYNHDDIIAINKPYGISTEFSTTEGGRLSIENALEALRKLIAPNSKRLYIMHRLDKTTTGILLLAASQLRWTELRDMFREKKIEKKYWTVVRRIPEISEGIIDIPLNESKICGRFKTVPVVRLGENLLEFGKRPMPEESESDNPLVKNTPVTGYRVMRTGQKCALLECTIRSGFTHQIRSHLGFGLGTPVLGDHKYSNYLEYKPQRLPSEMLHKLGIRSAKSRGMPQFLHAREILIPEYANGRNLHIKCLLPKYFVYVLRKLRIPLRK